MTSRTLPVTRHDQPIPKMCYHMHLKTNSKIPGNTRSSEATSHLRPNRDRDGITPVNSQNKTLRETVLPLILLNDG